MSTNKIGTIIAEIDNQIASAVGSVITICGRTVDAKTGDDLIVAGINRIVEYLVKERVLDMNDGTIKTLPAEEDERWTALHESEYDLFDDVQPADATSRLPYTFRWQPTREHLPLFSEVGIYELWFRFVAENSDLDDIRLRFEVKVGDPQSPRRINLT